jgi:hypothetical protein
VLEESKSWIRLKNGNKRLIYAIDGLLALRFFVTSILEGGMIK